jgi:hypothetical protein
MEDNIKQLELKRIKRKGSGTSPVYLEVGYHHIVSSLALCMEIPT